MGGKDELAYFYLRPSEQLAKIGTYQNTIFLVSKIEPAASE